MKHDPQNGIGDSQNIGKRSENLCNTNGIFSGKLYTDDFCVSYFTTGSKVRRRRKRMAQIHLRIADLRRAILL